MKALTGGSKLLLGSQHSHTMYGKTDALNSCTAGKRDVYITNSGNLKPPDGIHV